LKILAIEMKLKRLGVVVQKIPHTTTTVIQKSWKDRCTCRRQAKTAEIRDDDLVVVNKKHRNHALLLLHATK